MICPICVKGKTEVSNSRYTKKANRVWRRRRCTNCKQEFTTHETAVLSQILKVRSDQKKPVPYSRARLAVSILRACDHRKDPETVFYLCDAIEHTLSQNSNTITPQVIIKVVSTILKRFDSIAFVKYASRYQGTIDGRALRHLK